MLREAHRPTPSVLPVGRSAMARGRPGIASAGMPPPEGRDAEVGDGASFMFEMNRLTAPIWGFVMYSMLSMIRSPPGSSGVTACHSLSPLKITIVPGSVASGRSWRSRVGSPL
jgi:hypothetical protein